MRLANRYLTFIFAILLGSLLGCAGTPKTEGTGEYVDDIVITSNSDKPKHADYLDGTTVANYIKGHRSRTEMVNALGTMVTIHDSA